MADLVCALLPLRNGTAHILPGECLVLRLLVSASALPLLPRMVQAMPPKGVFCNRTLHFVGFREGIGDRPLTVTELTPHTVPPVTEDRLADRIASIQQWQNWKLCFFCLASPAPARRGKEGSGRCSPLL